jgi:FKBP-type peptidyl-prolyl cis-trans isomerase (trigger factor)
MAADLAHEYLHRIEDLNVDVDDFLKAQGLDRDKLAEQKTEEAKQKLQAEILLNQIAKEHELFPKIGAIQAEIEAITDPESRARLDTDAGRRYILSVMINRNSIDQLKKLAKGKHKS